MTSRTSSWIKGAKARLFLAALGKHPAWDDHMEIGLESDLLVRVRRQLYVEGIGAVIDSGVWDKSGPDEVLPAFGHSFLWRIDRDLIVGRMWASRDGKGRSKYPMLACFHASGVGAGWAWRELAPRLARVQAACAAADSQDGVAAAVAAERDAARDALQSETPDALRLPLQGDLARLASAPELGPERRGLHRILYECERELAPWRELAESTSSRTRPLNLTGHRLRVPVLGDDAALSLERWTGVVMSLVADSAPVFAVVPDQGRWVDVVVGDLSAAHLACLRTTPRKMALTSDVPYTLDPAFVARANALIDTRPAPAPTVPAASEHSRRKPAWLKWFGLAAMFLLVAAAVAILGPSSRSHSATKESGTGAVVVRDGPAPPPQPEPAKPAPRDTGATPPQTITTSSTPEPRASSTTPTLPPVVSGPAEPKPEPTAEPAPIEDEAWSRLPASLGDPVLDEAWRRGLEQIRSGTPRARALEQAQAWHVLLRVLADTPRKEGLSAADRAALDAARARTWREAVASAGDAPSATALASAQSRVRELFTQASRRQAELESAAAEVAAALASLDRPVIADTLPAPLAALGDRLALAREAGLPSALTLMREIEAWRAHAARSADELVAEARDTGATPWRRAAAWFRLKDRAWPASVEQLGEEVAVQGLIAALPGASALEGVRRAESESRWLRAASAAGSDPDAVRAVLAQLAPLRLPESLIGRAPSVFRLTLAQNELRAALSNPGFDDADLRSAVEAFLAVSDSVGGSPWDEPLRHAITPPRKAPPLEGVGPGSVGWRCNIADAGARVTYTSPRGVSIEFVRLEGVGGPDGAVYLTAGEVSLEQFIEIGSRNWDAIRSFLRYEEPDPRQGPRVWVQAGGGTDPIRRAANPRDPSNGWVVTFGRGPAYEDENQTGGPDLFHPMQQVSARAAIVAARLVGCRLPTSSEWRAAHAGGPAPAQNLRDSRWARHWQFLNERAMSDRGSVRDSEWPAAGIFRPSSDQPAPPPAEDNVAAVSGDDGFLWFAPAAGDSRTRNSAGFAHLVGNVAEWVFEAPELLEALSDLSPAAITRLIGDGSNMGVIGASALSPASIEADKVQRVDSRRSREMFSDVGFRLAFVVRGVSAAAAERPLRDRLQDALRSSR